MHGEVHECDRLVLRSLLNSANWTIKKKDHFQFRCGFRKWAIYASSEFGSGLHQSTSQTLKQLNHSCHARGPSRVLDVGTGSGVIGVFAAKMGSKHVTYLDARQSAIRIAAFNSIRNDKLHSRRFVHQRLYGNPVKGDYDLIVSNNVAETQRRIVKSIMTATSPRTVVMLGGIDTSLERKMIAFCLALGLTLRESCRGQKWCTLTFTRGIQNRPTGVRKVRSLKTSLQQR